MREYYPADLTACCAIYIAAFTAPPMNYSFLTHDKARRYLRETARMPGFRGFVFHEDDEIAAFVFGRMDDYFEGTVFVVEEFAVTPDRQRGGIGTKAMGQLEEYMRSHDVDAISLQTSREIPAFKFYTALGYIEEKANVTMVKPL